MNSHVVFDKFAYVDRLRHAGVDEALARAHGDGLEQALREEVATKSDLKDAVSDLRSEIKDVEIALRSEIKDLRSEMQVGFAQVDAKIEKAMHDQVYKIVPLIGGLLGIFVVIIHLWK